MTDKHTFVICAYGDSPYLEDCIRSLHDQELASAIILYTSTPSPYIENLCQLYQIPLHTGKGGGIGKDWNAALSFVTTPYATIAHQDDIYLPGYSQQILAAMTADTLIAYSDYREIKDNEVVPLTSNLKIKHVMLRTLALFSKWSFWRKRVLAFGNPISCPAVTYHLQQIGDFQFDESMKVSLDWFAWYQLALKKGRFVFVDQSLMYHRIHQESETTNNIQNNVRTKEDLDMYRLFWPEWMARSLLRYYVKSQETNG